MSTITFEQAIETVNQLPFEQQEMLVDLLHKRLIQTRRNQMANDAQESLAAFRQGAFTAQTANQLIQTLHESVDEAE
jgi:hypothetical protein